jgi:hypothetical protein
MKVTQSVVESVRQVSGGTTVIGGASTAAIAASEKVGFVEWVNDYAVVIGLSISALGLIIHVLSVVINIRLKARALKAPSGND